MLVNNQLRGTLEITRKLGLGPMDPGRQSLSSFALGWYESGRWPAGGLLSSISTGASMVRFGAHGAKARNLNSCPVLWECFSGSNSTSAGMWFRLPARGESHFIVHRPGANPQPPGIGQDKSDVLIASPAGIHGLPPAVPRQ